jgi:hypothetical protein
LTEPYHGEGRSDPLISNSCGKTDSTKNLRLACTCLTSKVVEGVVPERIVGDERPTMLKLGICGFEFPHHVVVTVVTIVDEYHDISELSKPAGENFSGVTDMNLPSSAQPLRNEPAQMLSRW